MVRVPIATALAVVLVCPFAGSGLQAADFGPAGRLSLNWIPARFLAARAFPDLTTPIVVEGLPDWADTEHGDVVVKFHPARRPRNEMWKTLLADRMNCRTQS